jgi:TrbL/VirB6 plasmid conjugal transfer protein
VSNLCFSRTVRAFLVSVCVFLVASLGCASAFAQTDSAGTTASTSSSTSAASQNPNRAGDFAVGSSQALTQISGLVGNLISTAVTASESVRKEADKFAWGLGVITLVLAGVRFSGTHHPIAAWVNLFEEIAIVGVFVALYLGYTTSAPGFYSWFNDLAVQIGGATSNSAATQMATLGGTILDALRQQVSVLRAATDMNGMVADILMLALAFLAMCIAAVVFMYFSAIGQVQAAFGIVLGPIAIALGFSSYTRNYFVKWLDWMISAGMYVVAVAILMKLMGHAIADSVAASAQHAGTTVNSGFVFNLAVFILLLSFEIPKLAGIFGGGASATGTGPLKLARGFF